ncbi:MAG: polyphosphate kinase 2 [Candidatus Accumulibacter sp.]|nr:polyphosphate kinase 2 [Accumulibacter sp.]MBO3707584.1 polyphosphate kinase 2 [Candidatus Accumulibacter conexus]
MGKKSKSAKKSKAEQPAKSAAELETAATAAPAEPATKMSSKEYYKELEKLEAQLVHLQTWVVEKGLKVVILFEGRDGAGKGGTIKAITGRLNPRVFRVVALPTPTDREKTQMYIQRYLPHMPAAGEVVIFDRSWYNRSGVERVMGFATDEQVQGFLRIAPLFEKLMVNGNQIILLKYWLEVDMDEQTRRLEQRITDPRKQWKLSPMDLKSYSRWYDYSRARDDMFRFTDSDWAPWFVARSNDKKRVRLNIIKHILNSVPYEVAKPPKIVLPKRDKPGDYEDPGLPVKYVPEVY